MFCQADHKLLRGLLIILLCLPATSFCLEHVRSKKDPGEQKWLVALPLRFTFLQNKPTMLSGIKIGRKLNDHLNLSVSVYHSFYLSSFKAEADLPGFNEQPRLFINGMGAELDYNIYRKGRFSGWLQLMTGWGFMKYDLKAHNFKSRQTNYLVLEPAVCQEISLGQSTAVGLGIGYRPVLSAKGITYTSHLSQGVIPIHKSIPSGLNVLLTLKGFF